MSTDIERWWIKSGSAHCDGELAGAHCDWELAEEKEGENTISFGRGPRSERGPGHTARVTQDPIPPRGPLSREILLEGEEPV